MAPDDYGERAVDAGSRAVDQPAGRVLQDHATQYGADATETPALESGQAARSTPVLPSPFPPRLPDAGFVPAGNPLETCMKGIQDDAKFKDLYVAVVDLTGSD